MKKRWKIIFTTLFIKEKKIKAFIKSSEFITRVLADLSAAVNNNVHLRQCWERFIQAK